MRTFVAIFFALFLTLAGTAFAQETETSVEAVVEAETITSADLGIDDVGMLPTNPFYFFKEIGRGLQRALTFDAVRKAELDLKIASEKAAEAATVAEQDSTNDRGITRALMNYERAQARLRLRLETLQETSENPNIDRLLTQIAERQILHEKLLEGLQVKHEGQEEHIEDIRSRIQEIFNEISKKDTAEKFQERLEQALESGKGSALRHIRSLEILDRLQESDGLSDEIKQKLQELRNRLSDQASEDIEDFTSDEEEGQNRLRDALGRIPGDALRRSTIVEEIRSRVSDRAANALGEARDLLDETVVNSDDLEIRVEKQIKKSEQKLEQIETKLRESGRDIPEAVTRLMNQAKEHLEKAKEALRQGNPREAFGLARAAEAIISNILRLVEQGIDAVQNASQLLDRVRERLQIVPLPLDRPNSDTLPSDNGNGTVFCTQEYAPVCGANGRTYSNRCVAEQQNNVRVQYEGECRANDTGNTDARKYQSRSPEECRRLQLLCVDGFQRFDDSTGCGCESVGSSSDSDSTQVSPPTSVVPAVREITLEGDDYGFYPLNEIRVAKGTKVVLRFKVRETNVYYAGLDLRSAKFDTGSISPGESRSVEFTADSNFEFQSYWPSSGVLKATGRVIVE